MAINTPVSGGGSGGSAPTQVSAAERTAGTETGLRSFSPDDVAVMAGIHGPGGTPSAGAVSFTPTGDISATNVQAAIAEVDSEKLDSADIGVTIQGYTAVLAGTTASYTTAEETKLAGIETSADVTDAANVTAAGAVMDSELTSESGIKTLTVPDSTTISTFGASLVDDTTAAAALTTLGVSSYAQTILDDATATAALTTLGVSTFAQTLVDDADAATARSTLGLVIGTDVQAYSAVLAATTASYTTANATKLSGIEDSADVTDEANVTDALDGATLTSATVATDDKILIQDTSDADILKTVTVSSVRAGATVDVVSNVSTGTILGRSTTGTGDSEELSAAQARTILNVEDGADVTDEANVTDALDGATLTAVTPASSDRVLLLDASDSNSLRVGLFSSFGGGGGGGGAPIPNRNDNTTETLSESTYTRVSITTATITKTLPALSGVTDGAMIGVALDSVTEGTGNVTISRGSTDTIDWKGVDLTSVVLHQDGDQVIFVADSDNSQWRLVHDGIEGPWCDVGRATSAQTITDATATKLQWNSETTDYWGNFDSTTNYRWQPDIPGLYTVACTAMATPNDNLDRYQEVRLYKNGSLYKVGPHLHTYNSSASRGIAGYFQVYLNGSTDYVEIYFLGSGGTSHTFDIANSRMEIRRVR